MGISKGNKKIGENDLDCAIRELKRNWFENKDFIVKHEFSPKIELINGTIILSINTFIILV